MPERDPAINPVCPSCGSDAMIPDVFVVAAGYGAPKLQVGLNTNPSARVRKKPVTEDAALSACGECGLVVVRVQDPHALWDAHLVRLLTED